MFCDIFVASSPLQVVFGRTAVHGFESAKTHAAAVALARALGPTPEAAALLRAAVAGYH